MPTEQFKCDSVPIGYVHIEGGRSCRKLVYKYSGNRRETLMVQPRIPTQEEEDALVHASIVEYFAGTSRHFTEQKSNAKTKLAKTKSAKNKHKKKD